MCVYIKADPSYALRGAPSYALRGALSYALHGAPSYAFRGALLWSRIIIMENGRYRLCPMRHTRLGSGLNKQIVHNIY